MATPRVPSLTTPRILVARPDRVGDVILSTPVLSALRSAYPGARITFMVQSFVAPLLRNAPDIDDVFIYDPQGRHRGVGGFFRLMEELKAQDFQIAVVLQSQFKVAAAIYGVGIPHRLGPLSKIHSFFFFNRGTRQRRSLVEMHEADYNLQLLRKLGIRVPTLTLPTFSHVPEERQSWARTWLQEQGWVAHPEEHRMLVAIHPGMGGSALNWPESHYVDLIRLIRKEGHRVVLTGGGAEGELLDRIASEFKSDKEESRPIVYHSHSAGTGTPLDISALGAVFSEADLVVAPSTGPLHLAVALGKPVVSFYPPIRVQSALRWGPYAREEEKASVLVPEVYCGQDFKCRGSDCNYFPCMRGITPRQAMEEVSKQLVIAAQRRRAQALALQASPAKGESLNSETSEPEPVSG